MAHTASPTTRRSSAAVRALVLGAAQELFDERGYDTVGTREIAERAGVTQAMIFRHFGTKATLFVEAVCQPFYGFVTDYVRRWADGQHGSASSARDTEAFVDGLYRLLLDNRNLLTALSGRVGDTAEHVESGAFLQQILDRLAREVAAEVSAQDNQTMDVTYAVRFAFALVYGVAMLDDTLFPAGDRRPAHASIAGELAGFILRGAVIRDH